MEIDVNTYTKVSNIKRTVRKLEATVKNHIVQAVLINNDLDNLLLIKRDHNLNTKIVIKCLKTKILVSSKCNFLYKS